MCKTENNVLRSIDRKAQQYTSEFVHPAHGTVDSLAEQATLVERCGNARWWFRQQLETIRSNCGLKDIIFLSFSVFVVVSFFIETKEREVEPLDSLDDMFTQREAKLHKNKGHVNSVRYHGQASVAAVFTFGNCTRQAV